MGNASSVQDIKLGDKIGDGAYGEVFKAVWSGKQVAAKRIRAIFFEGDYDRDEKIEKTFFPTPPCSQSGKKWQKISHVLRRIGKIFPKNIARTTKTPLTIC